MSYKLNVSQISAHSIILEIENNLHLVAKVLWDLFPLPLWCQRWNWWVPHRGVGGTHKRMRQHEQDVTLPHPHSGYCRREEAIHWHEWLACLDARMLKASDLCTTWEEKMVEYCLLGDSTHLQPHLVIQRVSICPIAPPTPPPRSHWMHVWKQLWIKGQ